MRLRSLLFVAILLVSNPAHAAPILTTVSCDETGQYTCLTRLENFQVGEEVYNANFVAMGIFSAFGVDPTGNVLEQFRPLKTAYFWDNLEGARTFAATLADLLATNDIDGFLCPGRCEQSSAGRPYGYTYIPVYLQLQNYPPLELASCFAGTIVATGQGVHYCYNPGGNTQNWALISRVPEPATVATFFVGMLSIALGAVRSSRLLKSVRV